jgi:hypothetical protein
MPAATETATPRIRSRFGARRASACGVGRQWRLRALTRWRRTAPNAGTRSLGPRTTAWNSGAHGTGAVSFGSRMVPSDPPLHWIATLSAGRRVVGRRPEARIPGTANHVRAWARTCTRALRSTPPSGSSQSTLTFRKPFSAKTLLAGPCDRASPRSGARTAADGFPGSHGPAEGEVKWLRVNIRLPSRFGACMCLKQTMIAGEPRSGSGAPPSEPTARPGEPRTGLPACEMPDRPQSRLLGIAGDAS